MTDNNKIKEVDETQGVCITEHLVIRDVDTGQELVNQSSSSTNQTDSGKWYD